jgi:hypothetical protein
MFFKIYRVHMSVIGMKDSQLPRPGAHGTFDDLVTLLDSIGARGRIVADPVPFLETQMVPTDR